MHAIGCTHESMLRSVLSHSDWWYMALGFSDRADMGHAIHDINTYATEASCKDKHSASDLEAQASIITGG